jgi:hypothetical protein
MKFLFRISYLEDVPIANFSYTRVKGHWFINLNDETSQETVNSLEIKKKGREICDVRISPRAR